MKQLKEMLTIKGKFTSYCNICLVAQITTKNTSQLLYYSYIIDLVSINVEHDITVWIDHVINTPILEINLDGTLVAYCYNPAVGPDILNHLQKLMDEGVAWSEALKSLRQEVLPHAHKPNTIADRCSEIL